MQKEILTLNILPLGQSGIIQTVGGEGNSPPQTFRYGPYSPYKSNGTQKSSSRRSAGNISARL